MAKIINTIIGLGAAFIAGYFLGSPKKVDIRDYNYDGISDVAIQGQFLEPRVYLGTTPEIPGFPFFKITPAPAKPNAIPLESSNLTLEQKTGIEKQVNEIFQIPDKQPETKKINPFAKY